MGITLHSKSKSPVVKEAMKIASLIASFKFERGNYINSTEDNKLSIGLEALKSIISRESK